MLTAIEARAKVESITSDKAKEQLALVERKIELAIKDGSYETFIYKELDSSVIRRLESAGYKVIKVNDPRDGDITITISW